MKKVLATILALVMALGLCSVSWADTALTKGTDGKFHITSADDLKTFAAMVNNGTDFSGDTIVLDESIELTENSWTPIGNDETKLFKGTFDGDGHKITGLKITSGSYIGLFGYVGEGAEIKNVNLVGANVFGEKRVGALIGQIKGNATVSNCTVDSTSHVTGSDSNTGGLIGEAAGGITVKLEKLINEDIWIYVDLAGMGQTPDTTAPLQVYLKTDALSSVYQLSTEKIVIRIDKAS